MWKWILSGTCLALGAGIGATLAYLKDADPGEEYRMLFEVAGYASGEYRPQVRDLPRLVVENGREFDFGTMDVGEELKHTFEIGNAGSAPLTLKLVRTTCKCTFGELSEDDIPPGGTGHVILGWDAEEYQAEYRQSATIETNDPSQPILILSVSGRVVEAVKALPSNLVLGDAPQNDKREASLTLFAFKDEDLEITGYEWLAADVADFLEVRWEDATTERLNVVPGAKNAQDVIVTTKPGMPYGPFNETLRLRLSSTPDYVDIKVNGRIVSDISIVGAGYNDRRGTAEAGLIKQKKGLAMPLLVLIKGPYRNDVNIQKASCEPTEVLDIRIGRPTSYETVVKVPVEIIVPPNAPLVQRRTSDDNPGRIVLHTTHPSIPEIELLVGFAVVE